MSVASLCGVMVAVPGGRDASAGSRAEKPRQCFPRGAETLLESQDAHVYRVRRDGALRVYACHFEARVPRQLGDQVFDLVHRPPAMRLSGRLLASVHDVSGPGDNQFDVTYVVVTDLVDQRVLGGSLAGRADDVATVSGLVVRRTGSVAWISCQADQNVFVLPRQNCYGRVKWVFKRDAGSARRTLLDRGRRIDPRSLRLRHTTLSWTHDGRRRRARLR